jgi:hypothetical protein
MPEAKLAVALLLALAHAAAFAPPSRAQDAPEVPKAETPEIPALSEAVKDTTDSAVIDLSNLRAPLALERRLRSIERTPASDFTAAVHNGTVRLGAFMLAAGDSLERHVLVIRGNADIYGQLRGNLVALDGNVAVHRGGSVGGDIVAFNSTVANDGDVGGTVRIFGPPAPESAAAKPSALKQTGQQLAGTVGMFMTLMALGIAFVLLARPKLEVVADTASHSFARSLLAGFVGQILAVPTLAILVVGLIMSVVGILLLPFAVAAYLLLVGAGVAGGILAVAHSLGETYTRRQVAAGAAASPNSYRYVALGLGALAAPCLIGALFGWVPIIGPLLRTVAFLTVWLALTAGFGAMLLSRGGKRSTFAEWDAQ